jgi:magnesium chelatase family protein
MNPAEVHEYCRLDQTSNALMRTVMNQVQLLEQAYHRVLKLARTIADLAREEKIAPTLLAEA